MQTHVLILDDEKEIADLIEVYLQNEDYIVHKYYVAQEALSFLERNAVDLAILDVMMPEISGFEVLRKIREAYRFPVIMLTARVEDMDKITGLTIGADDYITKPFNPLEMIARVKAQLRRYHRYNTHQAENSVNEFELRGLYINRNTHECSLYGKELSLTPIEFSILWLLCQRKGSVVSSEELFETVWGEKYLDSNNTVMVHIRRLREKLNEPARNPKFIKTVWGVGYKISMG